MRSFSREAADSLRGRVIVSVEVVEKGFKRALRLNLGDGEFIEIEETGGVGADSDWYNWLQVTLNGRTIIFDT